MAEYTYTEIARQLMSPVQGERGISILSGYGRSTAGKVKKEIIDQYITPTGLRVPKRKKIPTSLLVAILGIDVPFIMTMAEIEKKGLQQQDPMYKNTLKV